MEISVTIKNWRTDRQSFMKFEIENFTKSVQSLQLSLKLVNGKERFT
jgi:hypothetical protein